MSQFCFNCFQEKHNTGPCKSCGYDPKEDENKYPTAIRQGEILKDRYIVGRVLGQGGFGVTYVALDFATQTLVAIKEYLPEVLATRDRTGHVSAYGGQRTIDFEQGKKGFLDEVNTLVDFSRNPNIVNIHDYFEEHGTAYFVMEFVRGMNLRTYVKRMGGRLGQKEAERILLPIMTALEDVHSKGLIHRDIAPDNIIVTADGSAKLIDFGAARYSTGEKSQSLDVVLKHGYAPREQYSRHSRQGAYTDVYAMAATYYYAVTGRVPPDSIDRLEDDCLVAPNSLGVTLSPEAERALYKALQVQAANRFQSMQAFVNALNGQYSEPEPAVIIETSGGSVSNDPLLIRAYDYLQSHSWENAEKCCDLVLDRDPNNSEAQLYKMMARFKVTNKKELDSIGKGNAVTDGAKKAAGFIKKLAKKVDAAMSKLLTPERKAKIKAAIGKALAFAAQKLDRLGDWIVEKSVVLWGKFLDFLAFTAAGIAILLVKLEKLCKRTGLWFTAQWEKLLGFLSFTAAGIAILLVKLEKLGKRTGLWFTAQWEKFLGFLSFTAAGIAILLVKLEKLCGKIKGTAKAKNKKEAA